MAMRRLTQTQIHHLLQRVDDLIGKLLQKELALLGPSPGYASYSDEEKLALIRAGKAKLKPGVVLHTQLQYAYEFPPTREQLRQEDRRKAWQDKVEVIKRKWRAKQQSMTDVAILGDSDEALHMLRGLEATLEKMP